ncbi:integrase [Vibrio astriarenae]
MAIIHIFLSLIEFFFKHGCSAFEPKRYIGRNRKKENSGLPRYLYREIINGATRYRFTLINGKKILYPIEYKLKEIIEAVIAYNNEHRSHSQLLNFIGKGKSLRKGNSLSHWLDKFKESINDNDNSTQVKQTKINDIERLNAALGHILTCKLKYEDIIEFIENSYGDKSKEVYNKKVALLKKLFAFLKDQDAIEHNFMSDKMLKPIYEKDKERKRHDLSEEAFFLIYEHAPIFLKVAMILASQSTHTVNEIHRIKRDIPFPEPNTCGIVWFDVPEIDDSGNVIFGTLYIHRNKTKKNKSSYIAIPVNEEIKYAVELSQTQGISSPYIVQRMRLRNNKLSKDCDHEYQVSKRLISEEFSKVRDQLNLYAELDKSLRPTFSQIRPLVATIMEDSNYEPSTVMGHSSEKTTNIYTRKSKVQWNHVPSIVVPLKCSKK